MRTRLLSAWFRAFAPALTLAIVAVCCGLWAGPAEDFQRLAKECADLRAAAKYHEAEAAALELRRLAAGPLAAEPARTADAASALGGVYWGEGRYPEAEPLLTQALAIRRKVLGNAQPGVADSLNELAALYQAQGRYAEAEPLYQESLAIRRKLFGDQNTAVADSLNNLARVYGYQGRYADAEPLCREALAIRRKVLGNDHRDVAQSLKNLGLLYSAQGRLTDAEPLLAEALAIRRKVLGNDHRDVAQSLNNLALLYVSEARYTEAEPLLEESLAIRRKALGDDHPAVATSLNNLALLYAAGRRWADAEKLFRQSLDIRRKAFGDQRPRVAESLHDLARLYKAQGRNIEAEPLVDQAIAIRDKAGVAEGQRSESYALRADIRWGLNRTNQALAELRRAMDLANQTRAKASGAEWEQATAFAQHASVFERMVAWQTELGGAAGADRPSAGAAALDAIERSRARGLLDQMELHGMDLLAGLPPQQAAALRRQDADARGQLTFVQEQLDALGTQRDLSPEAARARAADLEEQLRKAQAAAADAYAAVREASPAYRLAVGRDQKPVRLEALAKTVANQKAVLLEYVIGAEGGYVLVIPPDGPPRLEKLAVGREHAARMGIEAGPLTAERLGRVLCNDQATGVLQDLRASRDPETALVAVPALSALWEVLIPKPERDALASQKCRRLIVVPDGLLGQLPFETLVVEYGDRPRFLLDLEAPIYYIPSATVLMNLAERRPGTQPPAPEPVLTAGGCRYGQPGSASQGDVLTQLTPGARYGTLGGKLPPLPYTVWETKWVSEAFRDHQVPVVLLQGEQATEKAVRSKAPGRRLLHLACHGLVDQAYGNLFGCLALTPGPDPGDPADDGFLTLSEVYDLNLQGCELVILSACETNVGPQQRGEGVWAMSRGFLVAGSRRVVASNWLVDDQAAASVVSVFCNYLAAAEKEKRTPDYAEALYRAKRWARQQGKWASPYFWGTFVLTGQD